MLSALIVTLRQGAEAALAAGVPLAFLLKLACDDLRKSAETPAGPPFPAALAGLAHLSATALAPPIPWSRKKSENDLEAENRQPRVALVDLEIGECGTVASISLPPAEEHFLMRIGFFPGAQVRFSRRAPLGDPSIYSVDGTEIALREETARHIMVKRTDEPAVGSPS